MEGSPVHLADLILTRKVHVASLDRSSKDVSLYVRSPYVVFLHVHVRYTCRCEREAVCAFTVYVHVPMPLVSASTDLALLRSALAYVSEHEPVHAFAILLFSSHDWLVKNSVWFVAHAGS